MRRVAYGVLASAVAGTLVWHELSQAGAERRHQAPLGTERTCHAYDGLPTGFAEDRFAGMVRVPAGEFEPGSLEGYADERPAGRVRVPAFWMDRTEVTHAQFAAFVAATGYVTEAERQGGAAVFVAPLAGKEVVPDGWWRHVDGADWRHPEGRDRDVADRPNEPVVNVTYADAMAYARWLGRTLPTEAQWEWAARAGGSAELLEREPRADDGRPAANYWQGVFPDVNTREDGYAARAPVGCFPANGYGVHDLIGNVWEWTREPYRGPHQAHGNGDPRPVRASMSAAAMHVIKGGSFLCAADYCVRYRAAARHPHDATLGATHLGFRTVVSGH